MWGDSMQCNLEVTKFIHQNNIPEIRDTTERFVICTCRFRDCNSSKKIRMKSTEKIEILE